MLTDGGTPSRCKGAASRVADGVNEAHLAHFRRGKLAAAVNALPDDARWLATGHRALTKLTLSLTVGLIMVWP